MMCMPMGAPRGRCCAYDSCLPAVCVWGGGRSGEGAWDAPWCCLLPLPCARRSAFCMLVGWLLHQLARDLHADPHHATPSPCPVRGCVSSCHEEQQPSSAPVPRFHIIPLITIFEGGCSLQPGPSLYPSCRMGHAMQPACGARMCSIAWPIPSHLLPPDTHTYPPCARGTSTPCDCQLVVCM